MLEHAVQLALKLRIDVLIPDQYAESLAWAFMLTIPWWDECKQHNTFPLRDLGTRVLWNISTKPLSVLRWRYSFQKLLISSFFREYLLRNHVQLSLLGLYNFDHFSWMHEVRCDILIIATIRYGLKGFTAMVLTSSESWTS